MENATTDASSRSRRRHERVWFKCQAVLTLSDGKSIYGTTRDVSLKGVFLSTIASSLEITEGDTGFLRMTVLNVKKEFPCRVVHVSPDGVGLALHDKDANFAATLIASLWQDSQLRMGMDIASNDVIRVSILKIHSIKPSFNLEGQLVKISLNQLTFSFTTSPIWKLKYGDSLTMEIIQPRNASIIVDGTVSIIAPGNQPTTQICTTRLASMTDHSINNLTELIRNLNSKRLQNMMSQRSTALGLQSGSDLQRRSKSEIRHNLERFYGHRS